MIIVFGIIQILLFSSIFYFLTLNHRDFYIEQLKNSLIDNIKLLKNDNSIINNIDNQSYLDQMIKNIGNQIDTRITLINSDGIVIADSRYKVELMDNHLNRPEVKVVLGNEDFGISARRSDTLDQDMYYVANQFIINGDNYFIRLAKSMENINNIVRNDIYRYFMFLILLLIISNLFVWFYSKSIITPLRKIKNMAKELVEGKRSKIKDIKYSSSELNSLINEYNRLGDKLDQKIEKIQEEKNKVTTILNSMTEGVIAVNKDKKIILMNPKACQILNINCDKIKGSSFIKEIRNHKLDNDLNSVLKSKGYQSTDLIIKNPDKIYLECNFQTITDDRGEILGAIVVLIDVTRMKKLEEMRKDFVANVSHELKTPLTSIRGYADTIIDNEIKDYETVDRFVNIISKEATRLNLLINDLLDLSKLESYYFDLKPESIDDILDKPLRILQKEADKKKIEIIERFKENLPLVKMNKAQIENLLINLIDNAIKYNKDRGKITIRAYPKKERVYIEIKDTGIGIPEDEVERIFERFYRVDKARSKQAGGTGIGLSIVKHIIKGHSSEIEVTSTLDQGTTFKFYLNRAETN